jgi:hypothetical protein
MKTIVWDLDDVLNNFTEAWLKLGWQAEHPECHIAYGQLRANPPLAELNTTQAEYLASLDRFRLSTAATKLRPNPVLLDWFGRKGGQFHHHVLTARPFKTVAPGAAWVFEHFGKWIRGFHFVPSPRPGELLPAHDTTKADVLSRLGNVDYFVDDSPQNVSDAGKLGIEAFVFPQPWNRTELTVNEILEEFSQPICK